MSDSGEILARLRSLPRPVKVIYEAGPSGFGLCRSMIRSGAECGVVAPSKLQRPAGDRVKTDARDALHLARRFLTVDRAAIQGAILPTERICQWLI